VGNYDIHTALWENVSEAMRRRYGKENLSRLARDAKAGPATVNRIKKLSTATELDVLERVAEALQVDPWRLLMPRDEVPAIELSQQALDLAQTLDVVTDLARRARAYALAMHAIHAIAEGAPSATPSTPPIRLRPPGR